MPTGSLGACPEQEPYRVVSQLAQHDVPPRGSALPTLRNDPGPHVRRPRDVPAVREPSSRPRAARPMEPFYPLRPRSATRASSCSCGFVPPEDIFTDYAYFSSYSDAWVEHARRYVGRDDRTVRSGCRQSVVEVASNDGYLLQHVVAAGDPCPRHRARGERRGASPSRGASPPSSSSSAADRQRELVEQARHGRPPRRQQRPRPRAGPERLRRRPDGLLAPSGVLTMEFPHLLRLIAENQFDTIYHEHFSYFSFYDRRAGPRRPRARRCSTSRSSRRTAARSASMLPRGQTRRRTRCHARRRARGSRGGRRESRRSGLTPGVRRRGRGRPSGSSSRFLISAKRTGKRSPATAPPARATPCSTTAASAPTSSTSSSTATRTSRAGTYPGPTSRSSSPNGSPRPDPTTSLILPWNLRDEISEQVGYIQGMGRTLRRPDPRA